jgi:heme-degrading monooxygenase HmoA
MEASMYARVTRVGIKPDKVEEVLRSVTDEMRIDIQNNAGFKGHYLLGIRETGDSMVITMWDSQEAEEASRQKVAQRFVAFKDFLAGPPEPPITYEVLHVILPAEAPTT